ncbi:histidinol-phosphate aminotransferase [Gracilaria domingensis]|nr:histidinol-phosphate aminotransferase [Gracilaria domingensis]
MEKVWDTETQEVHGGQTWRQCSNYIADFSVTTNALGAPESATAAAVHSVLHDIHHYPAADTLEPLQALSKFIDWPTDRLLIGNGASEFIDLVMKVLPPGPFKPGPYKAAYMEYNRAAKAAGRSVLPAFSEEPAAVTVLIHPNSPTGDFMSLDGIRSMMDTMSGALVIDESFMPFLGPDWRQYSAMSLIDEYPDRLLVLASWTKLWACPGIRLGSIAASQEWIKCIKKLQTPWSCNSPAQAFMAAASKDMKYMRQTWERLPKWKQLTEQRVRHLDWRVNEESPLWVPWVFATLPDAKTAEKASQVAQDAGCPVRLCASFGVPECIRIGIREPEHQKVLFQAWEAAFGIKSFLK